MRCMLARIALLLTSCASTGSTRRRAWFTPAVLVGALTLLALASATASSASQAPAYKAAAPGVLAKANTYPLEISEFLTDPSRPKAGKRFTAFIVIQDLSTGQPLDWGETHCRGRIGSSRSRVRVVQ